MYACGFRIYFTPLPGFFSPFPHGTGSLSVDHEYLALEDGPPIFRQDFTCPALLVVHLVPQSCFRIQGYHLLWPGFPSRSANTTAKEYKALPISFATTLGISVDFCSCSYLDVSVRRVRFPHLWIQCGMTHTGRVSPFGHLRIKARLPAPRSFRRLPRPSSPVIAKASTTCTCSLDPITSVSRRHAHYRLSSRICAVFQVIFRSLKNTFG